MRGKTLIIDSTIINASSSTSSPSPRRRVAMRERGLPARHPRPSTMNIISGQGDLGRPSTTSEERTRRGHRRGLLTPASCSPWGVAKVITVEREQRAHRGAWPRWSPRGASNVFSVGRWQDADQKPKAKEPPSWTTPKPKAKKPPSWTTPPPRTPTHPAARG